MQLWIKMIALYLILFFLHCIFQWLHVNVISVVELVLGPARFTSIFALYGAVEMIIQPTRGTLSLS